MKSLACKIRVFLVFAFIAFLNFHGMSQTALLDSLMIQYRNANTPAEKMTLLRSITSEQPESIQRIAYAEQLLQMANENNAYFFQHSAELQQGIGYRFTGDLSSSLKHLLNSLKIAEENADDKLIGSSYGEIATTYASQGDIATSVSFMNKAIEIFEKQQDTLNLSIALLNTAYDYYTIDKLDTSILYGRQAEHLISNFNGMIGNRKESLLAYIRGNMGITQAALGNEVEAIESLERSISSLREIEDFYAVADFMKFLGEIEFEIGMTEMALTHALEALDLANRYGLSELNRDLNLLLFRIYQNSSEYEKALDYHLQYIALKDSIENKNVIRRMAQQQSAFELSQKETEVALLKAQRKNQRAVIIISIVVIVAFAVLALVIYVYYRSKTRINQMLRQQKDALERLNETKDKFFSIISHDLRGPISSLMGVSHLIRHFVEDDDKEELYSMADHMEMTVEQLTVLLDNLLGWAMQQQGHFPNVPEKVALKSMLEEIISMFSNMAAGKKIEISLESSTEVEIWVDRNSIHTVFRNLINNAIKFTEVNGSIDVKIRDQHGMAEIVIQDDGIGISKDKLNQIFKLTGSRATYGTSGEKGLGLGLQLVHEFVEMNAGEIVVDSVEHEGSTFRVRLPLFEPSMVAANAVKV